MSALLSNLLDDGARRGARTFVERPNDAVSVTKATVHEYWTAVFTKGNP
jgi:hypothetical protein